MSVYILYVGYYYVSPCVYTDVAEARPTADTEVRIFVALFPYDPSTMSPNRDAAEEELPFREGQIIKVQNVFHRVYLCGQCNCINARVILVLQNLYKVIY